MLRFLRFSRQEELQDQLRRAEAVKENAEKVLEEVAYDLLEQEIVLAGGYPFQFQKQ